MSAWRLVTFYMLPPPLLLTILLLLPLPRFLRSALLQLVKNVLFWPVGGSRVLLVHIMLLISGMAFLSSMRHTLEINKQALAMANLTPNQKMPVLARKWREERNFWLAAFCFVLWAMLYRFYALMLDYLSVKDRLKQLEGSSASSSKSPAGPARTGGVPGKHMEPPSAPPAEDMAAGKHKVS